ncbi:MAG: DtxR family transcriptional regulator [Actinobacteria bacterium]|nr:DtxR family transcriptional regulator [Actinomycetota bacterium]
MELRERQIEELLEKAWLSWEDNGVLAEEDFLRRCNAEETPEPIKALENLGLLKKSEGQLKFTAEGRRRAELVIRRHRLAERLLRDVLQVHSQSFEPSACEFEHCLDSEVTQSVCTLLGHPTTCPHGKPIPPGPCCKAAAKDVQPVVMSLRDLPVGQEARLAYISSASHKHLDQLTSAGLLPGVNIHVHQRSPAFVINVGQSSLALDEQIVSGIYVRPLGTFQEREYYGRGRGARQRRRRRGLFGTA